MEILHTFLVILMTLLLVFVLGPRPRLDARAPAVRVPPGLTVTDLENWLIGSEARITHIIDGTEARIVWQDPASPAKTPLCFLYIHGFSASRQ